MPTKRMFDLVVLTVILVHPVVGLAKMWATRKAADQDSGTVGKIAGGAVKVIS